MIKLTNPIVTYKNNIFQRVKEISFPEVFRAFHGAEVRNSKALSPFREEKTPSFHLYPDGWKDYGSGEYGDSVDFVAKLYSLQPLEAAQAICEKFGIPVEGGPLSREDKLKLALAKTELQRRKRLREAFENWTRLAGQQVRILAEAISLQLEEKGLDIEEDLLPLVHDLPKLEYWADVLTEGTEAEKIALYRDSDFRRWFPCRS